MAGSFAIRQSKTILPLFEVAFVLACFNHVASIIVNADHGSIRPDRTRYSGVG
jgi:hypothetical protein